jgi:hypothetical protein
MDDIDFHSVLQRYITDDFLLLSIHSGGYQDYWEYWTQFTGGDSYLLSEAGDLPNAVIELVSEAARHLSYFSLSMYNPDLSNVIFSSAPNQFSDLVLPMKVIFDVNLTVPPGMACSDYEDYLISVGDNSIYGYQDIVWSVPESECDCPTVVPTVTPTPTRTPTPTPTRRPTFTATQTPYPTFTPTPNCSTTGVYIDMPSDYFHTGDLCYCYVYVCNGEGRTLKNYPLFVILDVYGTLFFAPSFNTTFDNYLELNPVFLPGITRVDVIPEFYWPAGVGSAAHIYWYAGLTNPEMTTLVGDYDIFMFGWG